MTAKGPRHLTDEQFSDLLAGQSPSAAVEGHLSTCEYCRGELEAVEGTLSNFNRFSLTWAQREAARRVQRPSQWALQLGSMPTWAVGLAGTAVAVLIALGTGLPFGHEAEQTTAEIVLPGPTNAQIAQDNELLASIDRQLQYSAESAIPANELMVAARRNRHHVEAVVSN